MEINAAQILRIQDGHDIPGVLYEIIHRIFQRLHLISAACQGFLFDNRPGIMIDVEGEYGE